MRSAGSSMPMESRSRFGGTWECGPSMVARCSMRLSTPPREVAGTKRLVRAATARASAAQAITAGVKRKRPKDVVDQWVSESALELERYMQVVHELKAGGTTDFAMLSVALNEVRSLVQARLDV